MGFSFSFPNIHTEKLEAAKFSDCRGLETEQPIFGSKAKNTSSTDILFFSFTV